MPEVEPIRWSPERPETSAPIFYTAPGGWIITHEPTQFAPDRPWILRRHGQREGRFHTLKLAKSAPLRPELLDQL